MVKSDDVLLDQEHKLTPSKMSLPWCEMCVMFPHTLMPAFPLCLSAGPDLVSCAPHVAMSRLEEFSTGPPCLALNTWALRIIRVKTSKLSVLKKKETDLLVWASSVIMKRKQDSTMDKENYSVSQKWIWNYCFCLHLFSSIYILDIFKRNRKPFEIWARS